MKLAFQDLGQGITCIETHFQRPGLASCYLLQAGDQAVIIDTGTAHTVPLIMQLLEQKGIQPQQVRYVIPTHVHLDHAGGTGQLMQQFPTAELVIHPFGARHMIDPTKLAAGATAVYGEAQFNRDYGELVPVAEDRVLTVEDGETLDLDGRLLLCLDTPGHARHHICIWDRQSRGFFTGDTFGIAYPELYTERGPFMLLPSTPIQFDPDAWHQSLDRLAAYQPERMYLTHYCSLEAPLAHIDTLHQEIDAYREIALASIDEPQRQQRIEASLRDFYLKRLRQHGCSLDEAQIERLLGMDFGLCAQGLEVWLQKRAVKPA